MLLAGFWSKRSRPFAFSSACERMTEQPLATPASWYTRNALWIVGIAPVGAQVLGSLFNIFYNLIHIDRLLVGDQAARFSTGIVYFNSIVFPLGAGVWVWVLLAIRPVHKALLLGEEVEETRLRRAQRRLINLPWLGAAIGVVAWLSSIPFFLIVIGGSSSPLDPLVQVHLPISLIISGMIGVTHAVFVIELLSERLLYPVFFKRTRPSDVPGAFPLSLLGRGVLWAVSAGVCPAISLLLLVLAPHQPGWQTNVFAVAVAATAAAFGLTTAWLVGLLVARPVNELRDAAARVAHGDLNVRIDMPRADEFGPLIDEFNDMVVELRDKERLRETFGMHVGREAARQILQRDPGLGGVEEEVTVLFADIRGFTQRCSQSTASEVVEVLNLFLTDMVDIIEERCGGMVNKFLGDGLMAVFGAGDRPDGHAELAVRAAGEMLGRLDSLNERFQDRNCEPLAIGIGIHTGPAVVGVVGSPHRREFTVIGDTVNVASRVEALTKALNVPVMLTDATRRGLPDSEPLVPMPPQYVKGKSEPLIVFGLKSGDGSGS